MKTRTLLLIPALALAAGTARALPVVAVDLDPATTGVQDTLTLAAPAQFSVDIVVSGVDPVTPLNAFELDLDFAPAVLRALSVSSGGFLRAPTIEVENDVGTTSVGFAEATLLPTGASGAGVLASVLFETVGGGTSALDLNDVILSAPFGVPIPTAAVRDGKVAVTGAGPEPIPEPSAAALFALGSVLVAHRLAGRRRGAQPRRGASAWRQRQELLSEGRWPAPADRPPRARPRGQAVRPPDGVLPRTRSARRGPRPSWGSVARAIPPRGRVLCAA